MSSNDIKLLLTTLSTPNSSFASKISKTPQNSVFSYKEWSNKEREKFLLRKRKSKVSKAEKVKRRVLGSKIAIKTKKINRIQVKKTSNFDKNKEFLSKLHEKSMLKSDVFSKIMSNLNKK